MLFPSLRAQAKQSSRRTTAKVRIASELVLLAMTKLALLLAAILWVSVSPATAAPDAGFTAFIASLWPEAQAQGVSRATFDAETRTLEPDYKLPDLILPGRPATGAPAQAEFVQVPADYIKEAAIARLAGEGQKLMQKYRDALNTIEARFGVPATIVLARGVQPSISYTYFNMEDPVVGGYTQDKIALRRAISMARSTPFSGAIRPRKAR